MKVILDDSIEGIIAETRDEIDRIKNGGDLPPWIESREAAIQDLENQIRVLLEPEATEY
jgi:hypothetical protein